MHKSLRLSGICLSLAGGLAFLTLTSNSTGITGQSTTGCSCHGVSVSSTLISITGIPATGWVAGTAYPLTISVSNSSSAYSRAGFDLTANIGSFSAAGPGASLSGTTEVRHNTPKVFSSQSASWTVTWTAPTSSATALTFDCAGNAVNFNGNTGGDAPNQSTTTYPAAVVTVVTPPTTTTTAASAISSTTATLNGNVNANNGSTAVVFEWGTTMALGQTAAATPATVTGSSATAVSAVLTGLLPATTYHFQVKGTNSAGTNNGSHVTFTTTAAASAPTISFPGMGTVIGQSTATLAATVNANGAATTISFAWGITKAFGSTATPTTATANGNGNTATSVSLTGLTPAKKYYYRWTATSVNGPTNKIDSFTTIALSVGSLAPVEVKLYPNPATTELQISLVYPPADLTAWAVSINGTRTALPFIRNSGGLNVDIAILPAGTYYLLLKGGEKNYGAAFQKR